MKNYKIANNSTTTKGREKISTDLESLEFYLKKLVYVWQNLKTIKVYLIKLETDFGWQTWYVVGN